jgi:hypothetical protein
VLYERGISSVEAQWLSESLRSLSFAGQIKNADLLGAIKNAGFILIGDIEQSDRLIYINAVKALG